MVTQSVGGDETGRESRLLPEGTGVGIAVGLAEPGGGW